MVKYHLFIGLDITNHAHAQGGIDPDQNREERVGWEVTGNDRLGDRHLDDLGWL
jgi:hypothetical protein